MIRRTLLKGLAAAVVTGGQAKAEPPDLEKSIAKIREKFSLPAMGAAYIRSEGEPVMAVGGVRKLGAADAVQITDQWHIGSLTKSITAVLFAQAVEKGEFGWDDALQRYFPKCHADYAKITLRELFEHRAGFAHSGPEFLWNQLGSRKDVPMSQRAWWVPRALAEPRGLPMGKFKYSNLGCVVIGQSLEKRAGKSWEKLVKERLAAPLDLQSLGFGPTAPIWGHTAQAMPLAADNPAALGPAGTVHMGLADLARYVQWHLSEGKRSKLTLKPKSWEILHTTRQPRPDKAAGEPTAGWFVCERPWAKGDCFMHNGSNTMNYAVVWASPKADLAVLAVTNHGGDKAGEGCDALLGEMLEKLT